MVVRNQDSATGILIGLPRGLNLRSSVGLCGGTRNNSQDAGSLCSKVNLQATTQLMKAFAHPRNTHAEPSGSRRIIGDLNARTLALAVVNHLQMNFLPDFDNANFRVGAAGIAMYVSQTFLKHTKESRLYISRQASQFGIDMYLHFDPAALLKTLGVPTNRRRKPALVKQRWMQHIRESADFFVNF